MLEMEEKVKKILTIQISKREKMSMTSNNIQEFRNTTKRIHKIKENIEIHVKDKGKIVNEILIKDTPHLGK